MFGMAAMVDTIHDQDRMVRQAMETRLRQENIPWDWRCFDGGLVETLIAQSRLADVIVIGKPEAGRGGTVPPLDQRRCRHACAAPVLVVPTGQRASTSPAMRCWRGTARPRRRMRCAPACRCCATPAGAHRRSQRRHAGAAVDRGAVYLSRHGIASEVHEWPAKGRHVRWRCCTPSTELDAAYLVMGAYGHRRLRETVLGGVTRD